jgi:hypothetical protein
MSVRLLIPESSKLWNSFIQYNKNHQSTYMVMPLSKVGDHCDWLVWCVKSLDKPLLSFSYSSSTNFFGLQYYFKINFHANKLNLFFNDLVKVNYDIYIKTIIYIYNIQELDLNPDDYKTLI